MHTPAFSSLQLWCRHPCLHLFLFCLLVILPSCATKQLDQRLTSAVAVGRYGGARAALQSTLSQDSSDRSYILDRARLLDLSLADGQADAAEEVANQYFALLRTQGVNADRTVSSVIFSDGVRIWKGEPFEQALGYAAIAIQKAMRSEWDNARAASQSSLFLLKNFAENEGGGKDDVTSQELARRAQALDQTQGEGAGDRYLDNGYAAVKTDFTLGYLLAGVSSLALNRPEEAADFLHEAARVDPSLSDLAEELLAGGYNTILVIDAGQGPAKVSTGLDGAFTAFVPRSRLTSGRNATLSARVLTASGPAEPVERFPAALDVNEMAANHKWNNLEDVRRAKSVLGNSLLVGGGAVAVGAEDDEARWVGAGVALAGLLLKGTSRADTRHNEFLPQSSWVIPVSITTPDSTVAIEVDGAPFSRMLLAALDPPSDISGYQLRYVRIPPAAGQPWQSSGRVLYANDRYAAEVEGDRLPYIMGGRCVRTPSMEVLRYYQQGGHLTDYTLTDLENLYREEGIAFSVEDQRGGSRKHILEGGDSLVCPLEGTTGYARLFGQLHEPYQPRTRALIDAIERERSASASPPSPQGNTP